MPSLPLRPCAHIGCRELIASGQRCPEHGGRSDEERRKRERKRDETRDRPDARARGYDHAWMDCRKAYLAAHPWCEIRVICKDEPITHRLAQQVHHKRSIEEAPELRLDWDNLQSVCLPCHAWEQRRLRVNAVNG